MKYYLLKALVQYLQNFTNIRYIKRVDNNIIKIEFSRTDIIYFDLTKGSSTVFIKPTHEKIKKDFLAPFDIVLQKYFTNVIIDKVYLLNNDKVLNIDIVSKSSYKKQSTTLQLEFTGKNTNIIILNQNKIILEALRHIDEHSSTRVVKVGIKLAPLPKPNFIFEDKVCENIKEQLTQIYIQKEQTNLNNIKKQKISQLKKQQNKLYKILNNLDDIELLEQKSQDLYHKGNLLLSNLHCVKPYSTSVVLIDFEGQEVSIDIDNRFGSISAYVDDLFKKAKKLKQKASNQYLEEKNLRLKIEFLNRLINTISQAKTISEIEFYLPKKDKKQIKTKKAQPYQSFFIDGYKIMLGRDERENIYLLHNSKASDFWFHLQGVASSHVIVSNTKKTIPEYIINEAAMICAKFSTDTTGVFRVDYTQRRNVKIQNGANVLYNPYSTVVIKI